MVIDGTIGIIEKGSVKEITAANIHVTGVCNYHCEHCFEKHLVRKWMTPEEWRPYLEKFKERSIGKVNIAGGEPMTYPYLDELCHLLKSMGFVVSIVSNGSLMTEEWVSKMTGVLDWIGLSIDSPDEEDEIEIGRHMKGVEHLNNVRKLAKIIKNHGIKFKLNITVLKRSWQKDFIPLIEELKPDRVKVFRALTLKNANDDIEDTWSISDEEFDYFKIRHKGCDNIVFEDCKEIVGSYLMVDPLGRCMIDKGNEKRLLPFSSFTDGSLFSELDVDKYYARGGDYWSKRG